MDDAHSEHNERILLIAMEGQNDLLRLLEGQGYMVQVCPDEAGSLDAITAATSNVILLMLIQADSTGLELCRQLKADQRTWDIPILFIIPAEQLANRADCFDAGGADYIFWPFQPAEVLARVRTHVTLRRLQTDQQQFRAFFDHAPVGIGVSQHGITTAVNPAYVHMFGYTSSDEMIGTSIIDCIAPEERSAVMARVEQRMRGESVETRYPLTGLRRDGTLFPTICDVARIELKGHPTSVAFFTDITDRKKAEDALRISEMRYRTIMQNFPNGSFYLFDHNLRYILTQGQGMTLVGLTPAMLEGKTIWEALDADTCATLEPAYRAALVGKTTMIEMAYRRQIFEIYTLPIFDDQGVIIAGVAVTRVITEYRELETTLRDSQARVQAILNNAAAGIIVLNEHGHFLEVNDRWLAMTGYTSDELLQMTPWDLSPAEDNMYGREHFQRLMRGEIDSYRLEKRYIRRNGSMFWVEISVTTLYNDLNQIDMVLAVAVDISDRKQAEQEIRRLNAELEQRVRERTEELLQTNQALQVEIGEHQRTEQALRESQRFIQNIAHTIPDLLYVYDLREQRPIYMNRNPDTMPGYTPARMYAMDDHIRLALLHPDDRDLVTTRQLQRIASAQDGDILELEYRLKHNDGTWRWLSVRETVFTRTPDNQPQHVLGVAQDITERKQAEQSLREREATYRAMFEKNRAIKLLIEPHTGAIVDANSAAAEFYGYPLDTLCTMRITEINLLPPEQALANMQQARTEQHQYFVLQHRLASGSIRDVEVYTGPLEVRGRTLLYSIVHDITERRRAEAALQHSEARFRLLAEHAPDIIFRYCFMPTPGYEYISPSVRNIMGYTPEEFYADPALMARLVHPESLDLYRAAHAAPESYREPLIFRCICQYGRDIWLEQHTWPIFNDSGILIAIEGIARDITERKQAEQQLHRYAEELQERITETRQFVYIVSHDLRSPLVNLKGFASELEMAIHSIRPIFEQALECVDATRQQEVLSIIDDDIHESLMFIMSAVTRMDHLINALLKLSRMGQRVLDLQPLDMQELVATTLQTLAHQITMHKVDITVDRLPTVMADQTAMEQIMGNILTNAILYLDPARAGQIDISSERQGDDILIHIRDNGRGIASDDMDKIFAPFRRAGQNTIAGEGMGLTYVQALVRRHGGHIRCRSELGVGTTFTISLPTRLDTMLNSNLL